MHGERYQWHNDDPLYGAPLASCSVSLTCSTDGIPPLKALRLDYVKTEGYVSLRCVWTLGCPVEIRPLVQDRANSTYVGAQTEVTYAAGFQELFPGVPVPAEVGTACCAQFAVTRSTIHARPREEYIHFREWLLSTPLEDSISGRIMEYSWHIIFGKPAIHCPNVQECYCRVLGQCDLTSCSADKCDGRWNFPPSASLPQGWPAKGWQGEVRSDEVNKAENLAGIRQNNTAG
jgi:hypothetical protein